MYTTRWHIHGAEKLMSDIDWEFGNKIQKIKTNRVRCAPLYYKKKLIKGKNL